MKQSEELYQKFGAEAIRRLEDLHVLDSVIDRLKEPDHATCWGLQVNRSYSFNYWDDNDACELDKRISSALEEFQKEYPKAFVYYSVYQKVIIGGEPMEILNILFLTQADLDEPEESWKVAEDKRSVMVFAKAMNLTDDMMSDMGDIGIAPACGSIARIW